MLFFQAISKGYSINYRQFSKDESRRYGWLLSDFFVKEWEKHVKQTEKEIEQIILKHVLYWEPFPHFLKIYCRYFIG